MRRCPVCGSRMKRHPTAGAGFWRGTVLTGCGLRLFVCGSCGRRRLAWRGRREEPRPPSRGGIAHRSSPTTDRDRAAFAQRIADLRRAEGQAGFAPSEPEAPVEPSRRGP